MVLVIDLTVFLKLNATLQWNVVKRGNLRGMESIFEVAKPMFEQVFFQGTGGWRLPPVVKSVFD